VLTCSGMHGPPSSHVHFDDSLTAPSGTLPSDVRDAPACNIRSRACVNGQIRRHECPKVAHHITHSATKVITAFATCTVDTSAPIAHTTLTEWPPTCVTRAHHHVITLKGEKVGQAAVEIQVPL
jgi:hypothetical protein